jgi:hypothetical protein
MRGNQEKQEEVFSYVSLERPVPQNHPLRRMRAITERALRDISDLLIRSMREEDGL